MNMNAANAQTSPLAQDFVRFALEAGVLRFGEFKTKAGRLSPYFFNAGLFDDGAKLGRLAGFYARRLIESGIEFDMLFGPAYKGIPLAAAVAIELARLGRNVPFAYNRKEAKDHGEGGTLVGAPVRGRVLIVDDVMSAGTSVRESIAMIAAAGATPAGFEPAGGGGLGIFDFETVEGEALAVVRVDQLAVAGPAGFASEDGVDMQWSAVQYVQGQLQLPVAAIATLQDLLHYLQSTASEELAPHLQRVTAYRERYGV